MKKISLILSACLVGLVAQAQVIDTLVGRNTAAGNLIGYTPYMVLDNSHGTASVLFPSSVSGLSDSYAGSVADPEQALFREIEEETGLEVEILSTKPTFGANDAKPVFTPNYVDIHSANPPHKHIGLIYFAKASHDKYIKSDEHTDIKWLSADELDEPKYKLIESIKFYAREALDKAKTSRV